ncbi:NXPE family member 4-like isoform X1 [Mizuhopecten yessoensis]|uniref:NXPE family member 4 n=2 Tax=Mizuhopecten yessoensis TaxID=6573 RepID=A0A210QKC7_MIZYE|nr:NXPE family member 4-like isoform X1 [Mizuhopecten yessoensis]XP_021356117.1 NXPE family member 4-like isoform X1 [Mizuhopecten yessoensis]XP_021356118.1 NXPE family member 4-like isoform X1 [Mizuhopecten yessoensis]OWF49200.1 NXPE family member 4 [Mizuhopecten yessoensis]
MIPRRSVKMLICLVITVLALVMIKSLTISNMHFSGYFNQLATNVSFRLNDSSLSNIIKTALKMPMAAISRNILNRYSEYRQIQRVADFKELYDPRFCVVELDIDRKTKTFTAGTELIARIHLYNGNNKSLTQGGDLLNIWLNNADESSSVAGYVVDNMNGTYTGHVMAFWAGNVSVKVSVTNTKEGIGLFTNYVNVYGSFKFMNATFVENQKSEMTQCAPKTSGWLNKTYGGFCNLTHENFNISLFCGKPKSVPCEKWVKYGCDDSLYYDDITRKIFRYKDELLKQIHVTIVPSSKGDLDYPTPSTHCNVLPRAFTWNSSVPSGFLYRGVYHNLLCQPTVDRSKEKYLVCLKDRPVISIGDSTTRQWFFRLASFLNIKDSAHISGHAWQKFARAYNTTLGLDTEWQPHELPFHGSPGSDRKTVKSVAHRLDKIPGNSSAIVIIHWYAHIARCCDHVDLRDHVRHAKAAVVRLLTRSPDVQVFIKGPHLITYINANKPYAYIGMFVEQVLLEEFNDLLDKVIYLDQWDMSVATENVNIHPNTLLDDISLNNLINFACKAS